MSASPRLVRIAPTESNAWRWDPVLDGKTVASLIDVEPETLTSWRSKRPWFAPRAVKLDKKVGYRLSDLQAWVMEHGEGYTIQTNEADRREFLTVAEASAYLSISEKTIKTWRTRRPGYGPRSCSVTSRLRYSIADLNEWVERHLEPLFAGVATEDGEAAIGAAGDGPGEK